MNTESLLHAPEPLIVGLARTGDRQAFTELVRRHQSWIRNLMRRLSADADLADDLAQQAFLQAWLEIRKLRDPRKFPGWLKQIALNTWRQHARKSTLPSSPELPVEKQTADTFDIPNSALKMDLDRALASLPAERRMCVVLAYHEGQTGVEIATLTNLPLGTVKSHIKRGSEQLRVLLATYAHSTAVDIEPDREEENKL